MRAAWTISAVALVLGGCMALSVDGNQRKDQVGETVVGQSFARAKDGVCMQNIRQVRQGIQVYLTSNDGPPPSLADIRFPQELLVCPIDKKPYTYDPAAGTVKCDHPGHEKY